MMKRMMMIVLFGVMAGSACAAEFSDFLEAIHGKPNVTYYRKSNSIFASDGSAFQINGNSILTNYGAAYQVKGDSIWSNHGVIYQLKGNELWSSDGVVYKLRGDRVWGSNGTDCFFSIDERKKEKTTVCNMSNQKSNQGNDQRYNQKNNHRNDQRNNQKNNHREWRR